MVVIAVRAPICSMEISEGGGRGAGAGVGGWDVGSGVEVEVEVVGGEVVVVLGAGGWWLFVVEGMVEEMGLEVGLEVEVVELPERVGSVRMSTTVSAQKARYPSNPKSESGFSGDPNLPSRLESS